MEESEQLPIKRGRTNRLDNQKKGSMPIRDAKKDNGRGAAVSGIHLGPEPPIYEDLLTIDYLKPSKA